MRKGRQTCQSSSLISMMNPLSTSTTCQTLSDNTNNHNQIRETSPSMKRLSHTNNIREILCPQAQCPSKVITALMLPQRKKTCKYMSESGHHLNMSLMISQLDTNDMGDTSQVKIYTVYK